MIETAVILASLLVLGAEAPAATTSMTGQVLTPGSQPVPGVRVVAIDEIGGGVSATTVSSPSGQFRLLTPARPHRLGIVSPGWRLLGVFSRPGAQRGPFLLRVKALFATRDKLIEALAQSSGSADLVVPPLGDGAPPAADAAQFGTASGRVLDETGTGLGGVRVVTIDPARAVVVASTTTDVEGDYAVLTRAGTMQVQVTSPGLKVVRTTSGGPGRLDFVLGIDAAVETVTVATGEVLSFRMSDSSWPEYVPPAKVEAWLKVHHGVSTTKNCARAVNSNDEPPSARIPSTSVGGVTGSSRYIYVPCPDSVSARGRAKFWWLRLLETQPPNPAKLFEWDGDNAALPRDLASGSGLR